jgi:hypothetical protein
MPKSDPIENALNAIGELRGESSPERLAAELRSYVKHRSNLVVAKAAKVACEQRLLALVPELAVAFDWFMADPARLDKRCAAVTEILSALYEMDYLEPEPYMRALHHVQKEASFGPPVDVAATLRGISAQGLLRTRHPHALQQVLSLLVDPEPAARLGAVRALASNGGDAGLLLLRLKVLTEDEEADVLAECFSGLLAAAPEQSIEFVAPYINDDVETTAEAAIWALGQSRLAGAFAVLKQKWERTLDRSLRKVLIGAMAASRLPEAIDFLCAQVKTASAQTASDVIAALAPYAVRESVARAVRSAVEERAQAAVTEAFRREFET